MICSGCKEGISVDEQYFIPKQDGINYSTYDDEMLDQIEMYCIGCQEGKWGSRIHYGEKVKDK
jgi:hypothetical protein